MEARDKKIDSVVLAIEKLDKSTELNAIKRQIQQLNDAVMFPEVVKLQQQMGQVWKHLKLHDVEVPHTLAPERLEKVWRQRIDKMLATPSPQAGKQQ